MMDPKRWINTLPNTKNLEVDQSKYDLDTSRWINTIPRPRPRTKNINTPAIYSLTVILFICGLMLVSVVKNKTRNLQKEINNLHASISSIKANLHKTTLDYDVITSPANISRLAKEYLEQNFSYYKKSQIKKLNAKEVTSTIKKVKKAELAKKYSTIIKAKIVKRVETKTSKIKKLYLDSKDMGPKDIISSKKVQRWAGIQLIKSLLGVPIIPGR